MPARFIRAGNTASRRSMLLLPLLGALPLGCKRSSELSAEKAKAHATLLVQAASKDVDEIRNGLPKGAELLREYFSGDKFDDPGLAREALARARGKVQDLRVAKSTFFALVDTNGLVLRSDQENDVLAGRNLFGAFPELRAALDGKYVESRGEMAEAATVRGRDAQWVAAHPVRDAQRLLGVYATGWSWSAYAYRLENQLRSSVRASLGEREKEPLLYVYVVVGKAVFGAPLSPEVNARVIGEQQFDGAAVVKTPSAVEREITGRDFGIAFLGAPKLGQGVGIAVLRSET